MRMGMWSGRIVSQTEGAPTLSDIARGLASENRWGGQTREPWSVAVHSLLCLAIMNSHTKGMGQLYRSIMGVHALLHDAHEVMTGDVPRAFKTPEMSALQDDLDRRIYLELGVPHLWPLNAHERAAMKYVDNRALIAEAYVLAPASTYEEVRRDLNGAWAGHAPAEDVKRVENAREWASSWSLETTAKFYEDMVAQGLREVGGE